jgi:F-type H+-transporting ATPase subunit delta
VSQCLCGASLCDLCILCVEGLSLVTNKTAAIRYARALLDVAIKEQADLELIEREVSEFAGLFTQYPLLEKVLLNPAVPVPRKRAAVADLLAQARFTPIVSKLVTLLADRDRLVLVPDLLAAYRDRLLDFRGVVRAEVTTATPLDAGRTEAIRQGLASLTGRTVRLSTSVDPSIIGGLVARIGSTVYDASVTRQLERMRETLEGARD